MQSLRLTESVGLFKDNIARKGLGKMCSWFIQFNPMLFSQEIIPRKAIAT